MSSYFHHTNIRQASAAHQDVAALIDEVGFTAITLFTQTAGAPNMTNFITHFIAVSTMVALAGAASAETTAPAEFTYTPTAPVETTYAAFETTAKKACRINVSDAGSLRMKTRIESTCRTQLLADAIKATNLQPLIAYHTERTNGLTPATRQFATKR